MRRMAGVVWACAVVLSLSLSAAQAPVSSGVETRIKAALDEWIAQSRYPGAAVGYVDRTGAATIAVANVDPDGVMLAGSTGKTFFAAVALQMIEAGQLDLDAPIAKYLGTRPWFSRLPNASAITVRHLMTHTSGLVRYEMNPEFTRLLRANPDKAWTPEEEVAFLLDTPAPFAAGQGWDYSDTNYIVLGMIMEQITGTKLYDEVQRRFLTPLALTNVVPSTSRRIPKLIPGHAGARDPLGLPDHVVVDGEFVINPQFEWTGGGYATNARDLARWGHELYTGRALSAKARSLMIDAGVRAPLGQNAKYGLGVIIRDTPLGAVWGHSGFFPGYQTELIHVVSSGVTVAVQVNSSGPRAQGSKSVLQFAVEAAGTK